MKWQSFRNKEPKAQPPRLISQQEAFECIQRVHEELNQAGPWPENLTAWLKDNHKEVLQATRATADDVDQACLNQDVTGLERALAEYKRVWLEGLTLWRNREQQQSLLP
jgi:hypothetical protein